MNIFAVSVFFIISNGIAAQSRKQPNIHFDTDILQAVDDWVVFRDYPENMDFVYSYNYPEADSVVQFSKKQSAITISPGNRNG